MSRLADTKVSDTSQFNYNRMIHKYLLVAVLLAQILCRERQYRLDTPVDNPEAVPTYTQTEHYIDQVLDHYDYVQVQSWKQRYFAIEDFFNPQAGPVILYICGQSVCRGIPEARKWAAIIAERTQGLVLILEHRYYGKSMPFGDESLNLDNLKFLNTQQALRDLAYFIEQVKTKHLHKVANNPWITVGGSYPGAMSAWFRLKYPHLTIGAIASSAVVNAIEDFKNFDEQIYLSSQRSNNNCSDAIIQVGAYVEDQVTGPNAEEFKAQFGAEQLLTREFLFYWADVVVEFIQYGSRTTLCNSLKGKTLEKQFDYIKSLALKSDPSDYGSFYLKNQTFAVRNGGGARSWTFQVCTEFGWLQTFSDVHPMRSKMLDISFYRKWCEDIFGPGIYPKIERVNNEFGALQTLTTNLLMCNGIQDPWMWASLTKSAGGIVSQVADCQNCAHCVQLYTPSKNDSAKLKKIRDNQFLTIKKWIEVYWRSHSKKPSTSSDQM